MMMITMCEQVAEEESKVANQHRSSVDMTSHPQVTPACYDYSHDLAMIILMIMLTTILMLTIIPMMIMLMIMIMMVG